MRLTIPGDDVCWNIWPWSGSGTNSIQRQASFDSVTPSDCGRTSLRFQVDESRIHMWPAFWSAIRVTLMETN
jgi:hypothetical protein